MCDCIKQLDKQLADQQVAVNATLPLNGGPQQAIVKTFGRTPKGNRKDGPIIIAKFCPFCGQPYAKPEAPHA